jgi:acetoacetate decarboxylase
MPLTGTSYLVVTCRTGPAGLDEAVPDPLTFDEPLVCSEFMRRESSADFNQFSGARSRASRGQKEWPTGLSMYP